MLCIVMLIAIIHVILIVHCYSIGFLTVIIIIGVNKEYNWCIVCVLTLLSPLPASSSEKVLA